jgi:hypothetical protein
MCVCVCVFDSECPGKWSCSPAIRIADTKRVTYTTYSSQRTRRIPSAQEHGLLEHTSLLTCFTSFWQATHIPGSEQDGFRVPWKMENSVLTLLALLVQKYKCWRCTPTDNSRRARRDSGQYGERHCQLRCSICTFVPVKQVNFRAGASDEDCTEGLIR